ncbi:MAG: hypothetical protein KME13_25025 [Myxacorys californica WJT36-NPBG1]|nr:hypothetical protein [Myxacorys californica WJT36-NPBG1]
MSKTPIEFTVSPTGYLSCSGDDLEAIDTLTAHARRQAQEHRRSELWHNLTTLTALLILSAITFSGLVALAQTLKPHHEAHQTDTRYTARSGN